MTETHFAAERATILISCFRGEVSAKVERVILNLKIKQMVPSTVPPELIGEKN